MRRPGFGDLDIPVARARAVGFLEVVGGVLQPFFAAREAIVRSEQGVAHEVVREHDRRVGGALRLSLKRFRQRGDCGPPRLIRGSGVER